MKSQKGICEKNFVAETSFLKFSQPAAGKKMGSFSARRKATKKDIFSSPQAGKKVILQAKKGVILSKQSKKCRY